MRMLLCVAAILFAGAVQAQSFPNGPVSIFVPLAPGDAADTAARAMGEEISKALNVPVPVVNRPGGGGSVGAAAVAQARKDGQTILFAPNAALTFRVVLEPQAVTYDPQRDLVPLGIASRTPSVLVVRADAPYKTFAEMVDYAKKNPGKLRVGNPGPGSVGDFCIRLINSLTDAGLEPVPHAGAAPAVAALRGGHIEGVVVALGALAPHIRSGVFRGLATSSKAAAFADIPTLGELGYKEELFGIWLSFSAPSGIPEDARKALAAAVERAARSPDITTKLAQIGILQGYAGPEAMAAEMREELRRVGDLARKAGLVK